MGRLGSLRRRRSVQTGYRESLLELRSPLVHFAMPPRQLLMSLSQLPMSFRQLLDASFDLFVEPIINVIRQRHRSADSREGDAFASLRTYRSNAAMPSAGSIPST